MDQKLLWIKMAEVAAANPELTIDEVAAKAGLDYSIVIMPNAEFAN